MIRALATVLHLPQAHSPFRDLSLPFSVLPPRLLTAFCLKYCSVWCTAKSEYKKKTAQMIGWKQERCRCKIGWREQRRDLTGERVWRWAGWERVKGSNHRMCGEEEGANKQQSRRKSDKDGIDSRTTGRVTRWRMTYAIRQSDTNVTTLTFHALSLSPLYFASILPLLLDLKPCRDGHQMGSTEANTHPPATTFPHLTASTNSRHQLEPSQRRLRLQSWGWTGQSAIPEAVDRNIAGSGRKSRGWKTLDELNWLTRKQSTCWAYDSASWTPWKMN